MNRTRAGVVCCLTLGLSACAPLRPTLYPNEQYQKVGAARADADVTECETKAQQYVKSGGQGGERAKEAARNVAVGAAVGGAAGAVGGAIYGSAGQGAGAGAAGGATAGLMGTLFGWMFSKSEPEPTYRAFVEECLRTQGYDPIGWQ